MNFDEGNSKRHTTVSKGNNNWLVTGIGGIGYGGISDCWKTGSVGIFSFLFSIPFSLFFIFSLFGEWAQIQEMGWMEVVLAWLLAFDIIGVWFAQVARQGEYEYE